MFVWLFGWLVGCLSCLFVSFLEIQNIKVLLRCIMVYLCFLFMGLGIHGAVLVVIVGLSFFNDV